MFSILAHKVEMWSIPHNRISSFPFCIAQHPPVWRN